MTLVSSRTDIFNFIRCILCKVKKIRKTARECSSVFRLVCALFFDWVLDEPGLDKGTDVEHTLLVVSLDR